MLPCEIDPAQPLHPGVAPILITISIVRRTRRCPDEPWSWCVTIADFKFSATSIQGNFRAFSNSLIKNFSLGVTRCNDFAFWTHFLSEGCTRQSLEPRQPRFHGPISDSDCLLARQCARTSLFLRMATDSCKPFQKHAKVRFSCRSSPETSSSSTQRDESARLTECCHLTVFLAEDFQVTTTLTNRLH